MIAKRRSYPFKFSGCSSAWLERCVWDAEVAGSNPVTPKIFSCFALSLVAALRRNKSVPVAQLDRATVF